MFQKTTYIILYIISAANGVATHRLQVISGSASRGYATQRHYIPTYYMISYHIHHCGLNSREPPTSPNCVDECLVNYKYEFKTRWKYIIHNNMYMYILNSTRCSYKYLPLTCVVIMWIQSNHRTRGVSIYT